MGTRSYWVYQSFTAGILLATIIDVTDRRLLCQCSTIISILATLKCGNYNDDGDMYAFSKWWHRTNSDMFKNALCWYVSSSCRFEAVETGGSNASWKYQSFQITMLNTWSNGRPDNRRWLWRCTWTATRPRTLFHQHSSPNGVIALMLNNQRYSLIWSYKKDEHDYHFSLHFWYILRSYGMAIFVICIHILMVKI